MTRSENLQQEAKNAGRMIAASRRILTGSPRPHALSLTVLIENHKSPDLDAIESSHGISILVERDGEAFLLDMGGNDLFHRNAFALGKDLGTVTCAFISHGHRDHGGGLEPFLQLNPEAPVYVHRRALTCRHFVQIPDGSRHSISLDSGLLDRYPDRLAFVDRTTEISNGVFVIPAVSQQHPIPVGNRNLFKEVAGTIVQDDFDHEQLLVFRTERGLCVFSGCSHSGVLNVVQTVREQFPNESIAALVGGFHLFNPVTAAMSEDPETVRNLGTRLLESQGTLYITGHCTGTTAYGLLQEVLGDRLAYFSTGAQFHL